MAIPDGLLNCALPSPDEPKVRMKYPSGVKTDTLSVHASVT